MKGRYLMLGALCALAALVAFTVLPESAFAAPLGNHAVFTDHAWRDFAIQASPALIALRSRLSDLGGFNTGKGMAEVR